MNTYKKKKYVELYTSGKKYDRNNKRIDKDIVIYRIYYFVYSIYQLFAVDSTTDKINLVNMLLQMVVF